jgi:hypothetical protein
MTNDRPDFPSEGAPVIDKTIFVIVNRNKYQVVRPSWALKPGLTDRLVVGRKVTLTLTLTKRLSDAKTNESDMRRRLRQPGKQQRLVLCYSFSCVLNFRDINLK